MDQVITCPIEAGWLRRKAQREAQDAARAAWVRAANARFDVVQDNDALRAELARLKAQFDPHFEMSDDYTFWCTQRDMRSRIASLERDLALV